MKIRHRSSIRILLFAMLLTLFSCNGQEAETPKPSDKVIETVKETETTTADLVTEKYLSADLQGYEYRVLAPSEGGHFYSQISSTCNEVWYDEISGNTMDDAIYQRNMRTEELLNIKITPV